MRSRKLIFVCLLLFVSNCLSAQVDTLDRAGNITKKGDTTEYFSIFEKFNWLVTTIDDHGNGQFITRRPDTLFQTNDLDTAFLSASFVVIPSLMNKIFVLHYYLEGSLLVRQNGQTILATGMFQKDLSDDLHYLIHDDFKSIIFTDTLQKIDITYLPYPHTKIFDLSLKINSFHIAEEKKKEIIKSDNDDFGMGFYYLAFGIIFMIFFIYFREKTENLYFSLFCLFAGSSLLWGKLHFPLLDFKTDFLYNLNSFLGIFCFEFLSIFFCKVLKNKEKSKAPLMVIALTMALCYLPFIRYNYLTFFDRPIPGILTAIYVVLYFYVWGSSLFFLVQGFGKKQWEARVVLLICFIPIVLFVLSFFVVIIAGVIVSNHNGNNYTTGERFGMFLTYFTKSIVYIYPLAAVFILARRNGLNQKQLIAQVLSIRQLSEENLAKEKEKKQILEGQKESLEKEVAQRTSEIVFQKQEIEKQHDELKIEKKKSDDLLRNILPEEIAEELKEKGFSEARLFDNVTVLFADFVDFTKAGEAMTPQELVNELHICFKNFDDIISRNNIEKIKTIGDAYLAVCGLPVSDAKHAENVVRAALEINEFMRERQNKTGVKTFHVRIGIHSGSVVAGIVGVKKFAYDIWGDTVNTAARMEQSSEPGKINISQTTYELIKDKFGCTYRGEIEAKNKGVMKMYFVTPQTPAPKGES